MAWDKWVVTVALPFNQREPRLRQVHVRTEYRAFAMPLAVTKLAWEEGEYGWSVGVVPDVEERGGRYPYPNGRYPLPQSTDGRGRLPN